MKFYFNSTNKAFTIFLIVVTFFLLIIYNNGSDVKATSENKITSVLYPVSLILDDTVTSFEIGDYVYKVNAYDPDEDSIYFHIMDGNDCDTFIIDSLTGIIRVNNPVALDERKNGVYNIIIKCEDIHQMCSYALLKLFIEDIGQ